MPAALSVRRFHRHACAIGRIALGVLFAWAGAAKLADPRAFAAALSRFDFLPEASLPVIAIGLPLLEIAAGAGAALDRRWALPAILGMLLCFIAFLGAAWLSGIDVDCGCFGAAETQARDAVRTALARNGLLIAGAGWLIRARGGRGQPSTESEDTK
jgi:uncharacterized membrane protein YphA (DoxX/SURF4 family)